MPTIYTMYPKPHKHRLEAWYTWVGLVYLARQTSLSQSKAVYMGTHEKSTYTTRKAIRHADWYRWYTW